MIEFMKYDPMILLQQDITDGNHPWFVIFTKIWSNIYPNNEIFCFKITKKKFRETKLCRLIVRSNESKKDKLFMDFYPPPVLHGHGPSVPMSFSVRTSSIEFAEAAFAILAVTL